MVDTEKTLGSAIRARRKGRKMTLSQLALLSDIDVSQLSKIERGVCRTSFAGYDKIAKALGWTPALMWRAATSRRAA
jgi:transcriptional regulator with XRE-family HTH domain